MEGDRRRSGRPPRSCRQRGYLPGFLFLVQEPGDSWRAPVPWLAMTSWPIATRIVAVWSSGHTNRPSIKPQPLPGCVLPTNMGIYSAQTAARVDEQNFSSVVLEISRLSLRGVKMISLTPSGNGALMGYQNNQQSSCVKTRAPSDPPFWAP